MPYCVINRNIELQENRVIDLLIHNHLSSFGVVDLHFEFILDIDTRTTGGTEIPERNDNNQHMASMQRAQCMHDKFHGFNLNPKARIAF